MSRMAASQDYYEMLGVARDASQDDIRKAFRKLARQHHPDVNGGSTESEEQFKVLKQAYDVLSDPQRRRHYDQFGTADPEQLGGDFGADIFDLFFGGARRESRRKDGPQRGSDLRYDLELTLEEAAAGVEKTLSIDREQNCSVCSGSGARAGTSAAPCQMCGGAGQVRRTQQTILGSFASVSTCPRCQGEGSVIADPCPACRGRGRERVPVELNVTIPAGVDSGMALSMPGEGDRGRRNGPPGDLAVVMHVAPHEKFERRGNDLYTELPLTFAQAALGADVSAPTLFGSVNVTVPPGTQYGKVFRVRGQGIVDVNGRGRGDLHAVARIQVPEKLTAQQRQAVQDLAVLLGERIGSEHPSHTEREDLRRGGAVPGDERTAPGAEPSRDSAHAHESHGLSGFLEKVKEVFDKHGN